jgi:hypothetical protein
MSWLALLKAVLGFARTLTSYMNTKKLMDAGEAKAIARQLESSLHAVERARKARTIAVADFDANGVRDDDPNLRD